MGVSPNPNWDPALSAKVTTGGLTSSLVSYPVVPQGYQPLQKRPEDSYEGLAESDDLIPYRKQAGGVRAFPGPPRGREGRADAGLHPWPFPSLSLGPARARTRWPPDPHATSWAHDPGRKRQTWSGPRKAVRRAGCVCCAPGSRSLRSVSPALRAGSTNHGPRRCSRTCKEEPARCRRRRSVPAPFAASGDHTPRRPAPRRRGAEAAIREANAGPTEPRQRRGAVLGRSADPTTRSVRAPRAGSPAGEGGRARAPLAQRSMPVWCCRCSLAGHFRNYSDTETEGEIFNSLVQYFGDNLGRKVKTMPLVEETSLLEGSSVSLPVVIIGNGPSGICLSYMLSGYRPYLAPEAIHPNAILHSKLEEARHLSIVDQDLEYLSEGLEGRSSNPVAVLFDTLLHPDADFGYDYPSILHWKLEQHHCIPHLVLGKGPPGGAWH
uniref:Serine/arginine repetitive matrix protein 2-like n=1 Tax=Castor canadensis TaxID=51338 RepID=A0A8B7UZF6_CASCN